MTEFVPSGHFYSPIPSKEEAERAISRLNRWKIPDGIVIDDKAMVSLWRDLAEHMKAMPFSENKEPDGHRYHFQNNMYSYGDAAIYFSLAKHFSPKRIIEIGSGYSSALALDMREIFEREINLTFIEPFPNTLNTLLRPIDKETTTIITKKIQDVPLDVFSDLQENDILFVDSSHVAKIGSDVCFEIFDILPRLQAGVIVHFHDCFWPFEYPKSWAIEENRGWNELYFLRSFLMYNQAFRIEFFNSYFAFKHRDLIEGTPVAKNPGGGLWLRRVQ